MLTTIMHPMLGAMDGRAFHGFMEAFLKVARKAWFNYVCSLGMAIAPIIALILLWDDPSSASFLLTAVGLGFVIVGVYVVSNVWKEPYYDVMLAWDPEAMPADWEAGRQRYFTLNWIQLAATWTAFGLFLAAREGRLRLNDDVVLCPASAGLSVAVARFASRMYRRPTSSSPNETTVAINERQGNEVEKPGGGAATAELSTLPKASIPEFSTRSPRCPRAPRLVSAASRKAPSR